MKKDENTPRRAILEFLNKATPKESPATEDLIQTQQVGFSFLELLTVS